MGRGVGKSGQIGRAAAGGLAGLTVLLALAAPAAHAATFYVDAASPSASTAGPGTEAQPYSTITSAVTARAGAGNVIVVKAGTYREQVVVPASGAPGAPFVLTAQGSVVLDGAEDYSNPALWTAGFGGAYFTTAVTWAPRQVIVGGVSLTASTANTSSLPPNTFRYVVGVGLWVNAGGVNPGPAGAFVGRRNSAFVLSGRSWVTIQGFTSLRADDRAFSLVAGCSDVEILGNTARFANKYGIYVSDCTRIRIAGNVTTDNFNHGIMLTVGATACTIEDNESARNAVPGTRAANGLYMYGATNNVVRRNRWHDNQDSGQHMQSGANDNVCSSNLSWNNGDHGFDHLGATGTLHLNDVAYGNYKDGFSIEGSSTGTRLFNCIATENGLTTNEFDLWVEAASLTGFQSNDNLFWNSTAQQPVKAGSTLYSQVAAYAAATGQDSRTLQADPRFVSPATGNFYLRATSPAIDNGNSSDANWPATDHLGRPRADAPAVANLGIGPVAYSDRGALEFQPDGLPPAAALAVSPAVAVAPATVVLDASGSSDPEGDIASYRFDFGDGSSAGPQAEPVTSHTYAAGAWSPRVTVTDGQGRTSTATAVLNLDQRPQASLTARPATGRAPLETSFSAASSKDTDGAVTSYFFDFGDGSTAGPQSSPFVSHIFGTGTWRVRLRVSDNLGVLDTLDTPLVVTVGPPNLPPSAELSATPASGPAPLLVAFDAAGSADADGGIASYRFSFGDGASAGPQSSPATTHLYAGGSYTASVTVTDTDGATATRSVNVFVTTPNLAPNGNILTPAAAAVTVTAGQSVSFSSTASDPDGNTPLRHAWDFGGLGTSALAAPGAVVFPNAGVFVVTYRVTDALGLSDPTPDSCVVTVLPPDPGVAADQVHWTMSGPTSVTVDWRGPVNTLRYGLTTDYGSTAVGVTPVPLPWSSPGPYWEARINGLLPNTTYHYSVAGGTDYTFRTAPPRGSSGFTVMAEGDIGASADYPAVSGVQALIASQSPAFVLTVGDLSYANVNGIAAVDRFFNDITAWSTTSACMPIWGNHEFESITDDLRNYKGRFELPNPRTTPGIDSPNDGGEDWYWFDHGNVRFVAYPEPGATSGSAVWDDWYPYARALMDSAQADPAISFIVTFGHRPAYSSGHHSGEARLKQYLDQLGASHSKYVLNVNGHSHDYERSFPQSGVIHVTSGASGSSLEYLSGTDCKWEGGCPAPAWSAYRVFHTGSLRLRFTATGIEGTYLAGPPIAGEDFAAAPGTTLDQFVIGTPASDLAPVVTAPAVVGASEGGLLSMTVTAADPDGDGILSLSADLSRLPAGADAVFTPAEDRRSGVLTWHPRFGDAGSYQVVFTASNTLSGSASATLVVHQLDREPVVAVADTAVAVGESATLSFAVTATDPDADPITSFIMGITPQPPGGAPQFVPAPGNGLGTFSWTPGFADSGRYVVTFTAANALAGTSRVSVLVQNSDRAPAVDAPAVVNVPTGGPVSFAVTAADPDGDAIAALEADLSSLPPGPAPSFVVAPDRRSAAFDWSPGPNVSGAFSIRFTATNALAGNSVTTINVNHVDRAPVVSAPDTVLASEGVAVRFGASASDPDSTVLSSFSADLGGLPAGHDAQVTVTSDQRNATFQWTPAFTHAGTYAVRWIARDALADTAVTILKVLQADRPPVVVAPASATAPALGQVAVQVTASDPDGEPLSSLTADLSALPAGNSAVFTPAPDRRSGVLQWTPAAADSGTYAVVFRAANALTGSATTSLVITRPNLPPTAVVTVTPATGNAPLAVLADASGSTDLEGPVVSYRFSFGDGEVAGPQASPFASHVYAAGVWTLSVTVTDQQGAVNTRTVTVTSAAVGAGSNLCLNPSFETNANGWNSYGSSSFTRVLGGFDAASALQVASIATDLSGFGINDSPNWVTNSGKAGTRYRVTAWVRSDNSRGAMKLQVREYSAGVRVGPNTQSVPLPLSAAWQLVTVDYVTQATGSAIDVQVYDSPVALGEVFLVDDISIRVVPAESPPVVTGGPEGSDPTEAPRNGLTAGDTEASLLVFSVSLVPTVTRSGATLHFATTRRGAVRADLFDVTGRRVRTLIDDPDVAPGLHSLNFDAVGDHGDRLGSGVYFYRLQAAERSGGGRLVLIH